MLTFSRRFKTSLVKAQASNALNTIIEDKKPFYDMAAFQTEHMKQFFDKNGIIFPVETIIEKYQSEDYDFFLDQSNFLKVADSLEKFGANLDMDHEDAKDFIIFKKKLYKLYEVRARSAAEHAEFSHQVLEDELTHVYDAHKHHLATIITDNRLDRVRNQANLKGAFYKRKLMNPQRLKGLSSSLLAISFYLYNPYLWPYFAGNFITAKLFTLTPMAAAFYGVYNLSESRIVHSIERLDSGADEGKIKLSISASPFVTRDIIADPTDIHDGGYIGKLGISALRVTKGYDLHTSKEFISERTYAIDTSSDGNAWVDEEGMDWLIQKKEDGSSTTDDLYADLIHKRAKDAANTKREGKNFLQEFMHVIEK
mmetsp:Transcript_16830/g.18754  ORF Transcript_16830/g.18754 Transcript_16830/m.18754 type:complete len:368 (+) Transcript_16830:4-1107(+)